ncbi:MAG: hypothetical protein WCI89_02925 [bacterium]
MKSFLKTCFLTYWPEVLSFFATAAASLAVFLLSALRFPNDDQFILYRYVDNIVAGKGFVYNIGEQVLGSTTPLFTLVCAAVKYALPFVPTPMLVSCINILLLSISAIFFYKLSKLFLSQNFALFAVLIFALNLSRTIPEGMETPLFLLTFLAFLYYLFTDKLYLSSVLLSLTLLTRPDTGLIAALTALLWWQKVGWRETVRLTMLCIVVALPWLLFATWYFGSFVPQSLATKLHSHDIYRLSPLQGAKIQMAALSRIYFGRLFDPDSIPLQVLCNLLPFLGLVALGAWKKLSRNTWILLAIPVLYFLSFSISNPIIFPWYLSEMEPLWILLSIMGVAFIVEKIHTASPGSVQANRSSLIGVGSVRSVVAGLFLFGIMLGPLLGWARMVTATDPGSKYGHFEIAEFIATHQAPGDTVGAGDIGIVGYITGAYIIDFIGLVNSQSVTFYPVKDACAGQWQFYMTPPKLIEATQPTWLIAAPSQMEPCFLASPWFTSHYREAYKNNAQITVWKLNQNVLSKQQPS